MKQNLTVTHVAVVTMKILHCMCDCMVDSDVGTDDFSLMLMILHVCGHVHVQSYASPDMD